MSFKTPGALRVLIILTIAMYIVPFDYVGIGLATPKIRESLGFSAQSVPWILGGYVLTFGSFLVLGGKLGDLFGRRRMLLLGMAIFGVCSVLTALADSVPFFLGARVVKGIGSALLSANALASINVLFPEGGERNRSYGLSSFVGGFFSVAYLLTVGTLLTYGWRQLLWMNVPIVLVLLVLVRRYVPESTGRDASDQFDFGGAFLSVAAFGTLSFGIANSFRLGLFSPVPLGFLAASVLFFTVLVRVESRHPQPLFPIHLLKIRNIVGAYLICFFWSASNTNYPLNLFLQDVLHYTARQASLANLPTLVSGSTLSLLAAWLLARLGTRSFLLGALVFEIAGISLYANLAPGDSYLTRILPAAMITTSGFLSIWIAVRLTAVSGVAAADQGVASGAIFSMQQLGNSVGIPALSAILTASTLAHGGAAGGAAARLAGFHWMFLGSVGLVSIAFLAAIFVLCSPKPVSRAAVSVPSDEPSPEPVG